MRSNIKLSRRVLRLFYILLIVAIGGGGLAQAQEPYPAITPENAAQVVEVERLGNGVVRALVYSPHATQLAAVTTLGVWLIDMNADMAMTLLEGQGSAESVTFSPDGSQVAAGGDDGSVMVWDTTSSAVVARLENHLYPVSAVKWSSDGKLIASGDWSGVVRLWDTATWSENRVFPTEEKITHLVFADAATLVAYSGTSFTGWEIASGNILSQAETRDRLGYILHEPPDAPYPMSLPDVGQIEFWYKGEHIAVLDGFYGELGDVFFTEDGLPSGQKNGQFTPTVTSPDGSRMATFGNDGVIHLTDAATGEEIAALHGHIAINAIAFSPDGRLLVSASNDGTIGIWDATVSEDSAPLAMLSGHTSGVTDVAFNAEGTLLASTGYDGTVRLWGIVS